MVCFQRFPHRILDIVDWLTPSCLPKAAPFRGDDFMSSTKSSVNLDCPAFSPKACLILSLMSLLLSALSPLNKCLGFMQSGVSHLWQTISLSLNSPQKSLYDSLCAYTCFPSFQIVGYPLFLAPLKIMHPFSFSSTFPIKRMLICGPLGLAISCLHTINAMDYNVNNKEIQGA